MVDSDSPLRSFLQNELLRRCQKNPGYSLRAFSRSLGLEASVVSKILKGKRRVTLKTFGVLAERLGLSPEQVKALAPAKRLTRRSQATQKSQARGMSVEKSYASLELDQFEVISEWYHFAILELTCVSVFKPDARWIANTLGITVSETHIAVERLLRLGLLEIGPEGQWIDRSGAISLARDGFTSAGLKKLQRQILEKSLLALEEVPLEERDHSSMTMAIDSRKLPQARECIRRFRRELCELLKGDLPPRDRVYHLAVSLYPVSEKADLDKSSLEPEPPEL